MAIAIPALYDTQLADLRAALEPVQDVTTNVASYAAEPYGLGNRIADLMRLWTDLIDSGTLTETVGGSNAQFEDTGAFTGVNSLIGATFTFDAATATVALQGVSRKIVSNTANVIVFDSALPVATAIGDVGVLAWTAIDKDLAVLDDGKGFGATQPDPYGYGPSLVNAMALMIEQLGGVVPSYLTSANAEPFGLGSPHAGGNDGFGHVGLKLVSSALQEVRDTVAAYTAPA